MPFTREQKKEAYKKLPPEAQDFVMSNETTELIENLLKEAGLSEEQNVSADTEILYALYGLQPLAVAIANIANLSNKNVDDFSKLKSNLENNIFNKIPKNTEQNIEVEEKPVQNNIGEDFEQIILNQAKAMQPARSAPENLPTGEQKQEEKPKVVHNYTGESDPYREPLE